MEKIKWILFDFGGVVVHLMMQNPDGYTVGTRHFNQNVLEGMFYTKEYNNYMLGEISHEQFVGKYLEKNKLDLSVAEFDELFKKDVTQMAGMEQLFQKLEHTYKIALATNEGKVFTKYKVEASGLMHYLSKILPSYLLRELKPSSAYFKKTLNIISAKPNECIFIDDTKVNCDAAASLGIKSIHFKSTKQLEEELSKLHVL